MVRSGDDKCEITQERFVQEEYMASDCFPCVLPEPMLQDGLVQYIGSAVLQRPVCGRPCSQIESTALHSTTSAR